MTYLYELSQFVFVLYVSGYMNGEFVFFVWLEFVKFLHMTAI
jgi:hypothetical protein